MWHYNYTQPDYDYPDELYHYGYIRRERKNGKWRYYYDHNDGDGTYSNKTGIDVSRKGGKTSISLYNTKNTKYWDKNNKGSVKNYGPLKVTKAEDGVSYDFNIPTKKKRKKKKQRR